MESLKDAIYEKVKTMEDQWIWKTRMQSILSNLLQMEKEDIPMELIMEILSEIRLQKKILNMNKDNIKWWLDTSNSKEKEKKDGWLKNIVKWIWDKKKYDYLEETDQILFYINWRSREPLPMQRTTALAMSEKYSRDWEHMSGKQMQYEFQLTPKAWQFIKWVLDMYKDSVPFDKVTLSKLKTKEEMEAAATAKAEMLTEGKMRKIYDDVGKRLKEAKLKEYAVMNWTLWHLLDKIEDILKYRKPIDFDKKKYDIPKINNNNTKHIIFWDAHLWKKWTDGVILRIKKMTRDMVMCPEKNIDITFLWDIGECFVPFPWAMHPDQRLWMEDITTEDLIMLAVDSLERMVVELIKAGKEVKFNWLWGNHWRFTSLKEMDPYRSAEMIVYRFLQRVLKDTWAEINILRDNMNVLKSWNLKFVHLHWDELTPAKLQRIAMQELEDWYYLIICSADKHYLKITEVSDRITWIQTPALAWKGRFDEWLALSSLSWYIEVTKNEDKLFNIKVNRLK